MVVPEEESGNPKEKRGSKKAVRRSAKDVKREMQLVERELTDLSRLRWKYSKRMLKFGLIAWLIGIGTFVGALFIYQGPALLADMPPLSISLMVIAASAPIFITVAVIRKFGQQINRLEQMRHVLMGEYESSLLKEVGKMVSG